jgi:hypothetical protein
MHDDCSATLARCPSLACGRPLAARARPATARPQPPGLLLRHAVWLVPALLAFAGPLAALYQRPLAAALLAASPLAGHLLLAPLAVRRGADGSHLASFAGTCGGLLLGLPAALVALVIVICKAIQSHGIISAC